MELVAVREADSGDLAYLVVFNKIGYIIEDGVAVRVNVNTALSFDAWEGDISVLSPELESKFRKAIDTLKSEELYRSGRKISQGA